MTSNRTTAPSLPPASAEVLYESTVWPALWDVLQLPSQPAWPPAAVKPDNSAASETHKPHQHSWALQHAVTHALLKLLNGQEHSVGASTLAHPITIATVDAAAAQLLLHPPTTVASTTTTASTLSLSAPATKAAVEIERLFVLICTAIQLTAQSSASLLHKDKVPTAIATGAPAAGAAAQLPAGVALASQAVVAGIYGVAQHLSSTSPVSTIAEASATVQPLWFTFLFLYLQQLSAHTPKDTAMYTAFIQDCGKEHEKWRAAPRSSGREVNGEEKRQVDAISNDAAARLAWSQVSPDLLKDTVARTRFRRAALLFKSFVPAMATQAPTLTLLLADLLCEFSRSWTAWMDTVPPGELDGSLAHQLAEYTTQSVGRGMLAAGEKEQNPQQWARCRQLIQAYGDRLVLLLGEGTPHAHLVAAVLCAVLSSLYIFPHTRPAGVSVSDVSPAFYASAGAGGAASSLPSAAGQTKSSAGAGAGAVAGAAGVAASNARSRRDEEAAVLELETAYRLPRRHHNLSMADSTPAAAEAWRRDVCVPEAEWRLRRYAPFGQLLAYAHVLELQKVHLFSVAATEMRVGRTAVQQCEHVRQLALASLLSGVAGWDLALLLYHFAETPLAPFVSPETSPSPSLPTTALVRYTAAVQQYVEQSRAELIVNTPFVEMNMGGFDGDGRRGGRRRGFYGGGGGGGGFGRGMQPLPVPQQHHTSVIPSRGELQTPRVIKMTNPDPVLVSWRAHVAAAEMLLAPPVVASPIGAPTSASTPAAAAAGAAAAPKAADSDALLSPCYLIRDLLVGGHYTLATAGMQYMQEGPFTDGDGAAVLSMNVLLPPRRAFPLNISVVYYVAVVLRRWLQRWETLRDTTASASPAPRADREERLFVETVAVLRGLLPLLSVVQSYLAHQSLLMRLVSHLAWLSSLAVYRATPQNESTSTVPALAVVEEVLIYFVMPCLRVLPPAPMVYDVMDDIMEVFAHLSTPHPRSHIVIPYGDSPATPLHGMAWLEALLPAPSFVAVYRTQQQQDENAKSPVRRFVSPVHPHDALQRKEREALLSHSLKRLNAENIEEYQAALRPILYAEPLLVAHRLFVQAIGYNNNFLDVHTHLLHGLPSTILMLIVHQGLLLMARYAAEEKVTDANGESRTAILATFLATLWRDNVDRVDGAVLARRVELALRSNSGDDILIGTELCKAMLSVMAYRTMEHEEKYTDAQMQALAMTPSVTSFFGRGAMMSFRMRYWKDVGSALLLLSPTDVFVEARTALVEALQQPCVVPLVHDDGDEEEEKPEESNGAAAEGTEHVGAKENGGAAESRLTLGQLILVHLCRLQTQIYELQRDLDGAAEMILLASAERFNTINDLIVVVEELLPVSAVGSVVDRVCALVRHAALPQIARYVEAQQRRKFRAIGRSGSSSSSSRGGSSASPSALSSADAAYQVSVLPELPADAPLPATHELLQHCTAAHFEYAATPYDAARQEWKQCVHRAQCLVNLHRPSGHGSASGSSSMGAAVLASCGDAARARRASAIVSWLAKEERRMEAEEVAHQHLRNSSAPLRAALLRAFVRDFVPTAPAEAAEEEEGKTAQRVADANDRLIDFATSYLLPRAVVNFREAATVAAFFTWLFQQEKDAATTTSVAPALLRRTATDLALTFVTALFTYFVAFTDGECKRIGYVLRRLSEIPALSSSAQMTESVATLVPELTSRLQPILFAAGKKPGEADATATRVEGAAAAQNRGRTGAAASSLVGAHGTAAAATGAEEPHTISGAAFFQHFLGIASAKTAGAASVSSSAPSAHLPAPQSLFTLVAARGLASGSKAVTDAAATTSAVRNEEEGASKAAAPPVPATPLQLEAFVCRALVQLFTHDVDVPAYAQRNQLLLLEQLDKTTFPSTLTAVDVLIRAVEPHAAKSKSYYALASAVLKALRVNRRHRREVQHAVLSLSRGDGAVGLLTDSFRTPAEATSEAVKESAAQLHTAWRLREHYMAQLLRDEVAQLLHGQQRHQPAEDEEDEEGDEEKEEEEEEDEGADGDARDAELQQEGESARDDGAVPPTGQRAHDAEEEDEEASSSDGSARADEEGEGDSEEDEESYSGSSSRGSDEEDDLSGEEDEEEDGEYESDRSSTGSASRKRAREE